MQLIILQVNSAFSQGFEPLTSYMLCSALPTEPLPLIIKIIYLVKMKFETISIQPGFGEYVENMRYIRVYSEYTMDNYDEIDLLSTVYPILETSEYNLFKEALEFATSINYTHPGLASKSYLKHPMRVAKLIANNSSKPSIDCLIIALLHNVFETSEISADLLCEKFGLIVTESIKRLTVDRSKLTMSINKIIIKALLRQAEMFA